MYTEEVFDSTVPEDLKPFLGKHLIYTYENGWQYELYLKNEKTVDYRIHSGMVAGRWVRDQLSHIVRIADQVVKISWDEPTGTTVSLTLNFAERRSHGVAFFPRWVRENPEKTVCFQNDHTAEMLRLRDAGPTYPKFLLDEFSEITFVEDCGINNEAVIACAPAELPAGYASRIK